MAKCKYCSQLDWYDKDKDDKCYCPTYGHYVSPESEGCKYNDKKEDGRDPS